MIPYSCPCRNDKFFCEEYGLGFPCSCPCRNDKIYYVKQRRKFIFHPLCGQMTEHDAGLVLQFGGFLTQMDACSLCRQRCCQIGERYIQSGSGQLQIRRWLSQMCLNS